MNYADSQCLKGGFCGELDIEDERIFGHDFYGFFFSFFFIHTYKKHSSIIICGPLATVYWNETLFDENVLLGESKKIIILTGKQLQQQ